MTRDSAKTRTNASLRGHCKNALARFGFDPLDANGRVTDFANMGKQIRHAYVNAAALLARFGATLDDVVGEVMYVLDLDAAFAAAPAIREAYARALPQVANTLVTTPRLAFREQLVEIKFVARLPTT